MSNNNFSGTGNNCFKIPIILPDMGPILSKEYQFNKNKPYLKNISWLISLLPKMKSIFLLLLLFDSMKYKFKNRIVLEILKKLMIAATNLLVCYLIVVMTWVRDLSRDAAYSLHPSYFQYDLSYTKSTNFSSPHQRHHLYQIAWCHLIVRDLSSDFYRLSFGRGRGGRFGGTKL